MKKIIIIAAFSPLLSWGQFSAEIGAGSSNLKPVFKLDIAYKSQKTDFSTGYICHLTNKVNAGAIINLKSGYFILDNFKLMAGYGWHLKSTDHKEINTGGFLTGLEFQKSFMNISWFYYAPENIFALVVGIKGFIQ